MLKINEIFFSIQGESTFSGWPCVFIRLTFCNLRCSYCDTVYSYEEGAEMSLADILSKVKSYDCDLVEITGGEPLVQERTPALAQLLLNEGYKVLLETSGSLNIGTLPAGCRRIVDFKTPGSRMAEKNLWENVAHLRDTDEVKFVLSDREDYDWTRERINQYDLLKLCPVSFSPSFGELENKTLAEWILADSLPVRLNLQIHKYIWDPQARGV